jgi:hypothetical protein
MINSGQTISKPKLNSGYTEHEAESRLDGDVAFLNPVTPSSAHPLFVGQERNGYEMIFCLYMTSNVGWLVPSCRATHTHTHARTQETLTHASPWKYNNVLLAMLYSDFTKKTSLFALN